MSLRRSSRQTRPSESTKPKASPAPARKTPGRQTSKQLLAAEKVDTPPSKRRKTRGGKNDDDDDENNEDDDDGADNDDPFAFKEDTSKLKRPGRPPKGSKKITGWSAQSSGHDADSDGSEGSAIRVRTSLSPPTVAVTKKGSGSVRRNAKADSTSRVKKTPRSSAASKGKKAAAAEKDEDEVQEGEEDVDKTPRARGGRGALSSKLFEAPEASPAKKQAGRPRKSAPATAGANDGEDAGSRSKRGGASARGSQSSKKKATAHESVGESQSGSEVWEMEFDDDAQAVDDGDMDVFSTKPLRSTKLNAELLKAATPKKMPSAAAYRDEAEKAEEGIALLQPEYKYAAQVNQRAVNTVQKHVMAKITGRSYPQILAGLDDEYKTINQLMEQTISQGEGNSMLLIGPRGSGKTAAVERSILELQKEYPKDFLVVRLNGLIQNDEKTAVREIWRQLGVGMEIEEQKAINFADTLTSVLALLSHPSEHVPENAEDEVAETATSISVIFLISEFELFALHSRQTLLYNLFDIAQAKKAPIAVIGMTTRVDAVELLEKRVKSRFSHRTTAFKIGGSAGNKLDGWWQVLRGGLCIDVDEIGDEESGETLQATDWKYFDAWNEHLDFMFKSDAQFRDLVNSIFWQTKDVKYFYSHCLIPICELTAKQPFIGGGQALLKDALIPPDNKLYMLQDLPELALALLICAARLGPILDTDMCNFTMTYDEYKTLVAKVKVYSQSTIAMKIWNKEVSLSAWETLADHELIIPIQGGMGGGYAAGGAGALSGSSGLFRREARMYRVDVGLMEIKKHGRSWGMGSILQSWCTI